MGGGGGEGGNAKGEEAEAEVEEVEEEEVEKEEVEKEDGGRGGGGEGERMKCPERPTERGLLYTHSVALLRICETSTGPTHDSETRVYMHQTCPSRTGKAHAVSALLGVHREFSDGPTYADTGECSV